MDEFATHVTMGQLGKDKAQIKATFDMFDLDHDVRGHHSTAKEGAVMLIFPLRVLGAEAPMGELAMAVFVSPCVC